MDNAVASLTESEPTLDFFYNLLTKNEEVGDLIRQVREKKGITQKQLASLSGISAVQLCRIENNECTPSQLSLKAISVHIGISYSLLKISAGYNNVSEKLQYVDKDGTILDTDSIIASLYYADPELLGNLKDLIFFTNKEDILVLKLLLKAMRKEKKTTANVDSVFNRIFFALKKFIIESMMPFMEE